MDESIPLSQRSEQWLEDHAVAMRRRHAVHDDPAALAEARDCERELDMRAEYRAERRHESRVS